jgi:hypothetical protein
MDQRGDEAAALAIAGLAEINEGYDPSAGSPRAHRASHDAPSLRTARAQTTQGHDVLYSILALIHLILFLIAAFEILTSSKSLGQKFLWLLLIFLLPLVGLVIYYLVGRGK